MALWLFATDPSIELTRQRCKQKNFHNLSNFNCIKHYIFEVDALIWYYLRSDSVLKFKINIIFNIYSNDLYFLAYYLHKIFSKLVISEGNQFIIHLIETDSQTYPYVLKDNTPDSFGCRGSTSTSTQIIVQIQCTTGQHQSTSKGVVQRSKRQ